MTENVGRCVFGGVGSDDRAGFGELTLLALVPEPSTGTLPLLGLVAFAARLRRS